MVNEIEEHARNLLLIIVGYVHHVSIEESKTAQFKQLVTKTYFAVG